MTNQFPQKKQLKQLFIGFVLRQKLNYYHLSVAENEVELRVEFLCEKKSAE